MVTQSEFGKPDKVMMGAERKSLVDDRRREDADRLSRGGAIVGLNVIATDPIHKATIIPRGRALGMVMQLPERDKLSMSLEQMTSRLAIMMGGRVAEELIFGREKVTSGLLRHRQATRLARMMVTRWGLSEELGTVSYGENQDEVFLGMSVSRTQNASEATVKRSTPRSGASSKGLQKRPAFSPRSVLTSSSGQGPTRIRTRPATRSRIRSRAKANRETVLEPTTPRTSAVLPAGAAAASTRRRLEPQPQA
jgi:cell division protease FtsH